MDACVSKITPWVSAFGFTFTGGSFLGGGDAETVARWIVLRATVPAALPASKDVLDVSISFLGRLTRLAGEHLTKMNVAADDGVGDGGGEVESGG